MNVTSKPPTSVFRTEFQIGSLCLVIIIGFALRVAQLDSLPLSLSLDEAVNAIDALRLFRSARLIPFLQNNFGRETLFFYLQSPALQLFGISVFSLRFVSALLGTLSIPLMYAVGQRLRLDGEVMPGLLAAAGLATSYWHIFFSRVALRGVLLPPLLLALVWCFWGGWYAHPSSRRPETGSRRAWLVVAGFLLGLTFYTYLAARLLPFIFVTFVAVELLVERANVKQRIADFLVFGLASALTAIPLALYFYQYPQAFGGRTQSISVLAGDAPFQALGKNLVAVLQIHLLGGSWLGQWPALNVLAVIGFVIGMVVCLRQIAKPASRFLLLWWAIGVLPMLFSQQNWTATTTILRSILAWPALFLISAIGLTTLVNLLFAWITRHRGGTAEPPSTTLSRKWLMGTLALVLIVGTVSSSHNYFFTWAITHNRPDDDISLAQYLNRETDRMSLIPLSLFQESTVNFLLQASYPTLSNTNIEALHTLMASPGRAPTIYLAPEEPVVESAFVLLVPSVSGSGAAYLLPPLTSADSEALLSHIKAAPPLSTIVNEEQEPIAHIYALDDDAPLLPKQPIPFEPIQANFNNDIWLTGYHVEPAIVKPGEAVTLYLKWQMQNIIDGDFYLFLHLFDIPQGQRRGQANLALNSIIHRWSAPLTFVDTYNFRLPPDSPEGAYRFEMGLYHNFSLERLPVIIGEANQTHDDRIYLGKFHVQRHPPGPPEYPIKAQFGDSVVLVGGDFPERMLRPGQTLSYTLQWQALDAVNADYAVFNHVVDSTGNIRAQQDGMPQQDRYPTSLWDPDEVVLDVRTIPLPSDMEPGEYTLRIGLYEPDSGQRLTLGNKAQDFVELSDFIILEAAK